MINYTKQFIDSKDINYVHKALRADFITQGKFVKKFENKLKNFFKSKYATVVNSGTSALDLACKSIELKKNETIVTTPITFLATGNCVFYNQANLHLIDIDKYSFLMDLTKLENFLKKKKVKAVIFVDFAGNVNNWDKIKSLSRKYKFLTINDNCHAIGSKYKNDYGYAVKYADLVTQSYHAAKIITTGEGGSVLTNNTKFDKKLKSLRSHGVSKDLSLTKKYGPWFYSMQELGYNYRLSDINCALGISQLSKLKHFVKRRETLSQRYIKSFKNIDGLKFQQINIKTKSAYHLFILCINFKKFKITKIEFFDKLKKKGINLQVHYIPLHYQKFYKEQIKIKNNNLKNSKEYYDEAVTIPLYHSLSFSNQKRIINEIKKILKLN